MKQVKLPKGKTFEFRTAGAQSKYKWDDMFTGDLILIEKGSDYDVSTDAMGPKVKSAARRRYKVVSVSRKDAEGKPLGDALILQSRDMTHEEKQAEDLRRAEHKAERAAEREASTPAAA